MYALPSVGLGLWIWLTGGRAIPTDVLLPRVAIGCLLPALLLNGIMMQYRLTEAIGWPGDVESILNRVSV